MFGSLNKSHVSHTIWGNKGCLCEVPQKIFLRKRKRNYNTLQVQYWQECMYYKIKWTEDQYKGNKHTFIYLK